MRKRFRVTVKAVDAASNETVLGTIVVDAPDRTQAGKIALERLWDPKLEAGGSRPATHVERIAGEGG
jgi:hypothetical protein